MRFDLVSIFPQYFSVLDLSLVGKAQQGGQLEIRIHDLRDWAQGRHRSVDDTPFGGGAGMVMRPDVWGKALDTLLGDETSGRTVLAIPTPSGIPLNQRIVENLAKADQIIVACGRYEGLDARIAESYRHQGVEVLEFSLGDYVLNGGEVAALALVEAVGRLVEGVVGNPQSLAEESHSPAGLLEYPVFTQPRIWKDLPVPEVLLSGDHAKIVRWRRDRALEKTFRVRRDLLKQIPSSQLDSADRRLLANLGWLVVPEPAAVQYRAARLDDLPALSALAANTFPDACPPHVTEEDQKKFIAEFLSVAAFTDYFEDPDYLIFVAEVSRPELGDKGAKQLAGYTLVGKEAPTDMGRAPAGSVYLSKCYTDQQYRGSGVTAALVDYTMAQIGLHWGPNTVVLATHHANHRAAKFYRKMGFQKAGRRVFFVGSAENVDNVFVADITEI